MKRLPVTKGWILFLKIVICLGIPLGILTFVLGNINIIYLYIFGPLAILDAVFITLFPFIFDDLNNIYKNDISPIKIDVNIESFDVFYNQLTEVLKKEGYLEITAWKNEQFTVYLYYNHHRPLPRKFFLVMQTVELTAQISEVVNRMVENYIDTNFSPLFFENTYACTLICVRKVTSKLRSLINAGVEQEFAFGRIVSALSFGGKKMYISPPANKFGIVKYKKLKKHILKILSFIVRT